MTFAPGDRVHLAGLGTGTIREPRGGGRYAINIKGRIVIAAAGDLELANPLRKPHKPRATASAAPARPAAPAAPVAPSRPALSEQSESLVTRSHPAAPGIDLHGMTVDDAIAAVELFVNDALLAGHAQARVIHGRGAGRVKAAVHHYFRQLPAVASFRLDPANPGVTIVTFA